MSCSFFLNDVQGNFGSLLGNHGGANSFNVAETRGRLANQGGKLDPIAVACRIVVPPGVGFGVGDCSKQNLVSVRQDQFLQAGRDSFQGAANDAVRFLKVIFVEQLRWPAMHQRDVQSACAGAKSLNDISAFGKNCFRLG